MSEVNIFGRVMGEVTGHLRRVAGAVNEFGRALVDRLMAPLEVVRGLVDSIAPLVQKANPGVIFHLTRAMDDFQAIIGQQLTPVLQGATIYIRKVADTMAQLTPSLQPLFNTLGKVLSGLGTVVSELMLAFDPFVTLISDVIGEVIMEVMKNLAAQAGILIGIVKELAAAFGLVGRADNRLRSNNAAVYTPQVSSVEQFARKQFEANLMGINKDRGQGKRPEEFIPEIAIAIREGQKVVSDILKQVTIIKVGIVEFFKLMTQGHGDRAKDAAAAGMNAGLAKALIS